MVVYQSEVIEVFKAMFLAIGFAFVGLAIWLMNLTLGVIGVLFLIFVVWWVRSTRSV